MFRAAHSPMPIAVRVVQSLTMLARFTAVAGAPMVVSVIPRAAPAALSHTHCSPVFLAGTRQLRSR